jgi:hypothetical protein
MAWDNSHGILIKPSECKVYDYSHSWGMKLSQLARQKGWVRIVTYSLPSLDYIKQQFERRPFDIWLLANTQFRERALEIKQLFPKVEVALFDKIHAKVLSISPSTLYVGSANFGASHWYEMSIGVRSIEAHDHFVDQFDRLWDAAEILQAKAT